MPSEELLGRPGSFGRRLLVLLLVAAPVPLALLGLISLSQFESRLREETDKRLSARAKDASLEVYRRLGDLGASLDGDTVLEDTMLQDPLAPPWRRRLRSLFETDRPDDLPPHPGAPWLDESQHRRILEGGSLLSIGRDPLGRPSLWLLRPRPRSPTAVVWAEVETEWLWPAASVPAEVGTDWVMLDAQGAEVVATSPSSPPELLDAIDEVEGQSAGGFEWLDREGNAHRARYWTVPLGFEFGHRGLTTLVSEIDPVLPRVAALRRSLVLVGSAALLFAGLVVGRRLRSDLEPLVSLTAGARRLEQGDLTTRVEISGPSDLARLGESFNRMAEGLERHFHLLEATHEVAIAALEREPNQVAIAKLFLGRMRPLIPAADLVVALRGPRGRTVLVSADPEERSGEKVDVLETGRVIPPSVLDAEEWVEYDGNGAFPPDGGPSRRSSWQALRRGDEVLGAIGIMWKGLDAGRLGAARTLLEAPTSQLALALSRARFLDDLERANWGALTAMARAVDAKSPWTQGHSERVARIAIAMAIELDYPSSRIRTVRRGALLHDVGKIGVPTSVLDKAEKLSPEELALLQTHVEKGARILEPMEGFADVLPIVWQHHERLDGSGYPRGLQGSQIDPDAMVVAVADVFEALIAPRPYRKARPPEETLGYLRGLAGLQFDERAVAALESLRESSSSWPYFEA